MVCDSGFETTADIHTVPAVAVHRSYGTINLSTTPSDTAASEIVTEDSDEQHDSAVAMDDRLCVGDTSIQHSNNEVIIAADMPAPHQTTA